MRLPLFHAQSNLYRPLIGPPRILWEVLSSYRSRRGELNTPSAEDESAALALSYTGTSQPLIFKFVYDAQENCEESLVVIQSGPSPVFPSTRYESLSSVSRIGSWVWGSRGRAQPEGGQSIAETAANRCANSTGLVVQVMPSTFAFRTQGEGFLVQELVSEPAVARKRSAGQRRQARATARYTFCHRYRARLEPAVEEEGNWWAGGRTPPARSSPAPPTARTRDEVAANEFRTRSHAQTRTRRERG